jgi:hypothetical protein
MAPIFDYLYSAGGVATVARDVRASYIDRTMTIVTSRPRKRRSKPAQAALIKVPRIVQHTPKGRAWRLPPPDDPEAKAKAVAFLERMIRPKSP